MSNGPAGDAPPSSRRAALAAGTAAFVAYFTISRVVENLYPFSVFDMYARGHAPSGSRIALRDERGELHEVTAGTSFSCERVVSPEACAGPDVYSPGYVDRAAADWIRAHAGTSPDARPADVVRRVWRFPDDAGPPSVSDCMITQCRVVLR